MSVHNGRDSAYDAISFPRFELHTGYVNGMHVRTLNIHIPERATRTQRFGSSHSDQHELGNRSS